MATVQISNDIAKTDRQYTSPSENKKNCNDAHKPTQVTTHFISPIEPKTTYQFNRVCKAWCKPLLTYGVFGLQTLATAEGMEKH